MSEAREKTFAHRPVMVNEVCLFLEDSVFEDSVRSGDTMYFVDGTVGAGGHSEAILSRLPQVFLVALDRDAAALKRAKKTLTRFADRIEFREGNFSDLQTILASSINCRGKQLAGILLDLGISSAQLDDQNRGFSFLRDGPLDMRLNQQQSLSAETVVNHYSERELRDVFRRGGLRKYQLALARAIVRARPIKKTTQLADVCVQVAARQHGKDKAHPATVPFQAIRIEVNQEFSALRNVLSAALPLLAPGGRLIVISFHSLEDQLVTREMRSWERAPQALRRMPLTEKAQGCGVLLTKHAVTPSVEEMQSNPRARSARMRVFEKQETRALTS